MLRTGLTAFLGVVISQYLFKTPPAGSGDVLELEAYEVVGASFPGARCRVRVRSVRGHRMPLWLALPAEPCVWAQGDRIEVTARQAPVRSRPGSQVRRVSHYVGQHRVFKGFWVALARWRWRLFVHCDPRPGSAFVLASVGGMPRVLRRLRRERLRQVGLGHLTAVSGLHVGLLAQGVSWFATRLGSGLVRRWDRAWPIDFTVLWGLGCALLPVLTFVVATGGRVSACRALGCWLLVVGCNALGLHLHRLYTLAWVAWVMLILEPLWWTSPGFYLSFGATCLLLWPSSRPLSAWSTSWQLMWGLAPLSLFFFGQASLVSVGANLLAIPVFGCWVLPIALVALGIAGASSLLDQAHRVEPLVFWLFDLAGQGGALILASSRLLSVVSAGDRWVWALIASWILVVYPAKPHWVVGHPLHFATRPLLWVLVSAPMWAWLGL